MLEYYIFGFKCIPVLSYYYFGGGICATGDVDAVVEVAVFHFSSVGGIDCHVFSCRADDTAVAHREDVSICDGVSDPGATL